MARDLLAVISLGSRAPQEREDCLDLLGQALGRLLGALVNLRPLGPNKTKEGHSELHRAVASLAATLGLATQVGLDSPILADLALAQDLGHSLVVACLANLQQDQGLVLNKEAALDPVILVLAVAGQALVLVELHLDLEVGSEAVLLGLALVQPALVLGTRSDNQGVVLERLAEALVQDSEEQTLSLVQGCLGRQVEPMRLVHHNLSLYSALLDKAEEACSEDRQGDQHSAALKLGHKVDQPSSAAVHLQELEQLHCLVAMLAINPPASVRHPPPEDLGLVLRLRGVVCLMVLPMHLGRMLRTQALALEWVRRGISYKVDNLSSVELGKLALVGRE